MELPPPVDEADDVFPEVELDELFDGPSAAYIQPSKKQKTAKHKSNSGPNLAEAMQSIPDELEYPAAFQAPIPQSLEPSEQDDFAEIFCPRRVGPLVEERGGKASISADLSLHFEGCDLMVFDWLHFIAKQVYAKKPKVLLVCPPCTFFSCLMAANWGKMEETKKMKGLKKGVALLNISMHFARMQLDSGRIFLFEHPHKATSFKRPCVKAIMDHGDVERITFDQCLFGNVSKVDKMPVKKRTVFLTNGKQIKKKFLGCLCQNLHQHRRCDGCEGGESRSIYAQRYPPELCATIADAVMGL